MRLQPLALADHGALELSLMTLPVLLQRCSRIASEEVERRRAVWRLADREHWLRVKGRTCR